jgi:hypothetical protein
VVVVMDDLHWRTSRRSSSSSRCCGCARSTPSCS